MSRTMRTFSAAVSIALLTTMLACGGGGGDATQPTPAPSPPPPASVASVVLSATALTLVPQQAEPLTASLRDAQGNVLTGRAVTWSTDAPAVAAVSADGRVSAVAVGTARISATSEGQTGSAVVTVAQGAQVGASGGTVVVENGAVTVEIPPGALTVPTVVTIQRVTAPASTAPAGWQRVGTVWAIGPAGITFAQPVTITLAYDMAVLPAFTMSGDIGVLSWSAGAGRTLSNVQVNGATRRVSARTTSLGAASASRVSETSVFSAFNSTTGESEVALMVHDPVVRLSPSVASVNSSHRYARFTVGLEARGQGIPLPENTPAPRYRWRSTRYHGGLVIDAPTAWTETTSVEYLATNPVLSDVRGEIDRVFVDVLLNPESLTDPSKGPPRIVSTEVVVNADLELAYDITPSRDTLTSGEAGRLRVRVRDKQGNERGLGENVTTSWETSGFHGRLANGSGAIVDYVANAVLTNPAPRVDRVVAIVSERVIREHLIRARRGFIDPTTGQPRTILDAVDEVNVVERARDTAFVTVGIETWVGSVSLTTTNESQGRIEWINRSEARDVTFTFVRKENGISLYTVTGGTLDYWTEYPCRSYVSPVAHVDLASATFMDASTSPSVERSHLIVSREAPPGVSGSAALWSRGFASVAALPRWEAVCVQGREPPAPRQWTSGWVMLWTSVPATPIMWAPSSSANLIQGTTSGVHGGPLYRFTWRLERMIR